MKRLSLVLIAIFGAAAAAAQSPQRTHDITIDDYFTLGYIESCAIAPDGSRVAYVEKRWEPPNEKRNSDIWVVTASDKWRRRITFDACDDRSPQWSADGTQLFFLSSPKGAGETKPPEDGSTQVWRWRVNADAALPVTRIPGGVEAFQLGDDGRTLYYLRSREESDEAFRELRDKFKQHVQFAAGQRQVSEIWQLDLDSWQAEKLVDEKRHITAFRVSPDQSRIAMLTTPDDRLITNEGQSRVDIFNAKTRKATPLPDKLWRADAPSPNGWLEGLAWSSDSQMLAFSIGFDGYPSELFAASAFDADAPKIIRVARPEQCYVAGNFEWIANTHDLLLMGELKARQMIWRIRDVRGDGHGPAVRMTAPEIVLDHFSTSSDGKSIAMVGNGLTSTNDVLLQNTIENGDVLRLTNVNPQVDSWKLPQISLVNWKAPDGSQVDGILELPADYQPGAKPLPLIVELHGGPTWSTKFRFEHTIYGRTAFPAKGYALLSPNYRGSTGYGDKFLTDLIGHENDIEVKDIIAGVNSLIEKGVADPKRMAVMGWSNGGFLTNCVITHDQRFKAASSGAGMIDQVIQWGIQDTPGHNFNYMRGLPWQTPDAYRAASPLYGLNKVKTATLIHCGEADERVPVAHSRTLFRALHDYVHVPTELLVYPGEGHGLSKYSTRKAKMEWDAAWFEKYVTGD